MSLRFVLGVIPALAGPLLFWLLLRNSGATTEQLAAWLGSLRPMPLVVVIAATGAHMALAGEKWRLVESRISALPPSRRNAIAYSAMGTALGQFLPPPLANAVIRGAGNRIAVGEGARRGVLTSVWEQLFDLGVVCVLCVPAAASLMLLSPTAFLVGVPAAALLADRLVGPFVEGLTRIMQLPPSLQDRGLSTQLYRLSLARFAVLVAITLAIAWAMGAPLPPVQLASIMPPVALGSALSFLPGGMGINEWSFVALLRIWSIPFTTIVGFAVVNRLISGAVALTLGLVGAVSMDTAGGRWTVKATAA